jgi:hypothetical protein
MRAVHRTAILQALALLIDAAGANVRAVRNAGDTAFYAAHCEKV